MCCCCFIITAQAQREIDHYKHLAEKEVLQRQRDVEAARKAAATAAAHNQKNVVNSTTSTGNDEQLKLLKAIKEEVTRQQTHQSRAQQQQHLASTSTGENAPPRHNNTGLHRGMEKTSVRLSPKRVVQVVPDVAANTVTRVSFVRQRTAKDGQALPSWYRRMRVKKQ